MFAGFFKRKYKEIYLTFFRAGFRFLSSFLPREIPSFFAALFHYSCCFFPFTVNTNYLSNLTLMLLGTFLFRKNLLHNLPRGNFRTLPNIYGGTLNKNKQYFVFAKRFITYYSRGTIYVSVLPNFFVFRHSTM